MAVGKPKLTLVTINSIDVTSDVVNWDLNSQAQAVIEDLFITLHKRVYSSVPELETSPTGLSVVIQRGVSSGSEEYVFRGEIVTRETRGNILSLRCKDKLYQAIKKNVTKTFNSNIDSEAGVLSDIYTTLVTDFAGLNVDGTTITDSGTILIAKTFICDNTDVFERLERITELLDWQHFYDPTDDKVYLQPKGSRAGTETLTIGTNVINRPKWSRDGSKIVKEAVLFGGPVEVQTTETVVAAASQTNFVLDNVPVSVRVTVDGTEKVGGIEGQSTGDYFVDRFTQENDVVVGQIIFDVALTGGESVAIQYSYLSPIVINGENTVDDGLETRITKPDLVTVDDAREYLDRFLTRHSAEFLKTTLQVTNVIGIEQGQTVTVIDSHEGINQTFVATKIRKRYPYAFDEISVDSEPLQIEDWEISIEDRLRRIEERLLQEARIVIFARSGSRVLESKREFGKIEHRDLTGITVGIYDNPLFGIYGTSLYGTESDLPATTLEFISQGSNIYDEDFLNDDFKDSGSTATWGSTGSVNFTSGQIAKSTSIDKANGTITQAKLVSTEVSGSFDYELTADGSNWETVTSGIIHTFINTGTDLRFRITENAASTGEISNTRITDYH